MAKRTIRKTSSIVPTRSAADWEDAALTAIAAHGLRSLSIPELARALGVTKGSFYWHFRGIQELIDAALLRWEEMDREALEEVRRIADPRARLTALFTQSMEKREAHALYVTLSVSSVPAVAETLRRLSDRRLQFLVDAYLALGFTRLAAREQALLAYTAYAGVLHLRQQGSRGLMTEKDLAAYVAHAMKTLIPRRR
ncbi:MAG: TetR/AcrR family transcriptional regulator [Acidobacteriota bacterium]|nr:TetR/AcrR family transcriptional regulator [Acidobacteriota bacterium]